jgi:transketolase
MQPQMDNIKSQIARLKHDIVMAACVAGEGHIASAFSILDILWVLYHQVLKGDPHAPNAPDRDSFILSKGHGALALYAILADCGYFPIDELRTFSSFHSRLGGHPDSTKIPGVEASTGSLGHGLPMGVGVAMGKRLQARPCRTFVLVGDGECNEGSIWEAALLASHHRLNRLTCIVDSNHSTDRALRVDDLAEKFRAFGWAACVVGGHDHQAICAAATAIDETHPSAIIAQTVKGRGCALMENNPAWHHRVPTAEELPLILQELS